MNSSQTTPRPLYVVGGDLTVARQGGRLVVRRGQQTVTSAPLILLSEVVIQGRAHVTTAALHLLLDAGIPLVLLTRGGQARGRLEPPGSRHVALRHAQLRASADPQLRLSLARDLVRGKIANQRLLVLRQAREHPAVDRGAGERLLQLLDAVGRARDVAGLRGIEGAAAAVYWAALAPVLTPYGFASRSRHGGDIVNCLLNYTSAVLRETVLAAMTITGLDSHVSFLHESFRDRPTLAFDLMEEWRPVLLEATVLALLGLRMAGPDDWSVKDDGTRLTDHARLNVLQRFHDRLEAPAPGRDGSAGTYRTRVNHQARLFANCLRELAPYTPYSWR